MKIMLSDTARLARNQYIREWREKNKAKVKAANLRYWERRAERSSVLSNKEDTITKENDKE